jgi:glycosyltransferase involved in cell wall biosynthesis
MPRVSVVVPTFNCAPYLRGAIESVIGQTEADFELIVVDDGSQDNTPDVMTRYLDDPRIRFIRQANRGLPGARNTGVRNSSGEYLAFLDADDALAPQALEVLSAALDHNRRAGWCVTDILRLTGADQTVVRSAIPARADLYAILKDDFIRRGMFFRKTEFMAIGMYDEDMKIREDWDLNIRMISAGRDFAYVPLPLYLYTMREGSITTANFDLKFAFTEKLLRKHHKTLADLGDRRAAAIYAELMWELGRRHVYATRNFARASSCVKESISYDFNLPRLVHPIVHYLGKVRA